MGAVSTSLLGRIKTKAGLLSTALIMALTSSAGLPAAIVSADPLPTALTVCATDCDYTTIPAAIGAIAAGGTITLKDAVHPLNSAVVINKQITLTGQPGATITTATPPSNLIRISVPNVTISNINFVSTATSAFNFITTQGNNTSIINNTFRGTYQTSADATSRGIEVSGVSGLLVSGNTFRNLRQPAYINAATGTVSNNFVATTRGWVAVAESNINFTGNSWGTGANANAVDIAIIPNSPVSATNNYTDVTGISNTNNNALVENQVMPGGAVLSDVYVNASVATSGNGTAMSPYKTLASALTRVAEDGRVFIADGTYTEQLAFAKRGTKLIGESRENTVIAPLSNGYGQGLTSESISDINIRKLTIKASSASGNAAVKVHNARNFTLNNVSLIGNNAYTNGVDINGVAGVVLNNISVNGFGKNGISLTSKFDTTDEQTRNVNISNVTSSSNAWNGIAFYTSNNTGTVGGSINNVRFNGVNTISNNGTGITAQGDSNAAYAANTAPRFTITAQAGGTLDLGTTNLSGNTAAFVNYQTKPVNAFNTTFNGKTGQQMTAVERQTTDASIVDKLDRSALGLVSYYVLDAPTNLSPLNGTVTNNPAFNNSWDAVPNAVSYEYRTSNNINPDGSLGTIIYSDTSASSNYTVSPTSITRANSGTPDGNYYWQVRALDAQGNPGNWSPAQRVTVDTTAPSTPTNGQPNAQAIATNQFTFTWGESTDQNAPLTYEFQSSLNPAESNGELTTNLWKSGTLASPSIQSSGAADGTWYWQVRAKDTAGNYSAWSTIWNVTLDTIAPATPANVTLADDTNTPLNNGGYTNSYQITANWDVVNDAVKYEYRYFNNIPTSAYNTATSPYTVFTTDTQRTGEFTEGEGTHYIQVRAFDGAGNASDWSTVQTITYDATAPTTAITSPVISGNTVTIAGIANDSNFESYQYIISRDGTTISTSPKLFTQVTDDTLATIDTTSFTNGTYTFTLLATDKAGNTSTPITANFVIDRSISLPTPSTMGGIGGAIGESSPAITAAIPAVATRTTAPADNAAEFLVAGSEDNRATTAPASVLSENSDTPQTSSTSTDKKDETKPAQPFLGLGWWWIAVLTVLAFLAAAARRRFFQNEA